MAEAAVAQEYNPAPPTRHEGVYAAAELLDRPTIEAEAWGLIANRTQLPKVEVLHQERYDNARTALMEAMTASGHLSTVELKGTLDEINSQVLNRLLNGWDDSLPKHEKDRRFAELCNELVIQRVHAAIVDGELPPDTEVTEISDFPEALRGMMLGYRDSNQKGMVRTTSLRHDGNGHYTRLIEQVSRSNGTWKSTFGFFQACGVETSTDAPDIAALKAPIIHARRDYSDGVVDIMRRLDQHAGRGVLYGDKGERAQKHPDYLALRTESKRRETEVECYFDDLAKLETQLSELYEAGKIPEQERVQIFQDEIQRILDAICILKPEYAEDTFGASSATVFEAASLLVAQGRSEEAAALLRANEYLKEDVIFCGMSISIEKAKELGLQLNELGELVEKGKESWQWSLGACRVKACPSPKPTKIGPCSVCKRCQREFDAGRDPTKDIAVPLRTAKHVGVMALADEFVARRVKRARAEQNHELAAA